MSYNVIHPKNKFPDFSAMHIKKSHTHTRGNTFIRLHPSNQIRSWNWRWRCRRRRRCIAQNEIVWLPLLTMVVCSFVCLLSTIARRKTVIILITFYFCNSYSLLFCSHPHSHLKEEEKKNHMGWITPVSGVHSAYERYAHFLLNKATVEKKNFSHFLLITYQVI